MSLFQIKCENEIESKKILNVSTKGKFNKIMNEKTDLCISFITDINIKNFKSNIEFLINNNTKTEYKILTINQINFNFIRLYILSIKKILLTPAPMSSLDIALPDLKIANSSELSYNIAGGLGLRFGVFKIYGFTKIEQNLLNIVNLFLHIKLKSWNFGASFVKNFDKYKYSGQIAYKNYLELIFSKEDEIFGCGILSITKMIKSIIEKDLFDQISNIINIIIFGKISKSMKKIGLVITISIFSINFGFDDEKGFFLSININLKNSLENPFQLTS